MRFLHVGDIHLKAGPFLEDTTHALGQVAAIAHAEKVDAVLIPGDVFDAKSSPAERAAFADFLRALPERALKVVAKGNHDAPGDLYPFGLAPNTIVRETHDILSLDGADLMVLPWPERGHLAAAGLLGEGGLQAAQAALGGLVRALAGGRPDPSRPLVIMGHLSVIGALSSSGQPLVGREIQVLADDLQATGAAYVALNHIHRPQDLAGAVYAGSLTVQDHGEEEEEKRVVLFDTQAAGPASIPILGRTWATIRAHLCTCDDRTEPEISEAGSPYAHAPGAVVRYIYTATDAEARFFDHDKIRAQFPKAYRVTIEPRITRAERVRAAEIATARTLEEKLRTWGQVTGTEISDSLVTRLHSLEEGNP